MTEPSKGTVVGLICVPSTQTLTKKAGTPSGQSSRPVVHQFQPSAVLVARSMATNSVLLTSRTLQPQVNAKAVFTLKPVRKSGRVQQTKKCQDKDGLATSGTLRSKFGPRTYTRVKNSGGCIINPVQTVTIEDDSQTSTSTSIQKSPTRPLRACRMKPVETAEIDLDEDEVYESDSDDDGKMRPTPRPNRVVNRTIKKTRAHLSDSVEVIIPDVITPKKRSRGPKIDKTKQKSSKCQVFFCDKCDKVYDQYSELVYHLRRHTGEKPFVCTWPGCKKAFSASNARVRHLRIHTGERPYACPFPECGRRFTYWKDLKLHKFRHTGEKPHKCDWEGCNSRFFRKDDLRHHRYTHTGERPYKCPVPGCGAAFTQKSPLNLHVRRIHKIETPIKVSVESAKSSEAVAMATTSMTAASTTCIPVEAAPTLASSNVTDTDFATSVSQNLQAPSLCSLQPNQHSLENDMLTIVPNNLNSESVAQISYASSMQTTSAMTIQATSAPEACTTTHCVHYPAPCQSVSYDSPSLSSIAVPLSPSRHDEDLVRPPETLKTIITNIQSSNFRTYSKLPRTEQIEASLNVSSTGVHEQEKQKEIETVTIDDNDRNDQDNSQKALVKPIRRRANYRLKVHPIGENNLRTTHNIIKVASGRKQQLKSDEAVRLKRTSKRTIAVQTMRRRGRKCNSDKINQDGLFECDFCQRVFKAKHDRDCHRMTHTGEKPRACEWPSCNYRCITKSKLTRHMRKHTGEKNYPCEWPECGKKFGTSRHLKEHSRCHTGEKPFKCDYPGCDKWFSRKDHIKNHRFTHTGERPRKCPFPGCEAAFIQLSPLKKHMELHKRDGANVPNRTRKKKQFDQQPTETLAQNNAIPSEPNVTAPSGGTVPDAPQERLSVNQSGLPEFGTENASQNFGFGGYENVMQPPLHLDYDKGYYFY